jgi:hypothetical protein
MTTHSLILATNAEDVRSGDTILGADGIRRTVRDVKYGWSTIVLVYLAGPSDVFRRNYVLDVVDTDDTDD